MLTIVTIKTTHFRHQVFTKFPWWLLSQWTSQFLLLQETINSSGIFHLGKLAIIPRPVQDPGVIYDTNPLSVAIHLHCLIFLWDWDLCWPNSKKRSERGFSEFHVLKTWKSMFWQVRDRDAASNLFSLPKDQGMCFFYPPSIAQNWHSIPKWSCVWYIYTY